MTSGPMEPARTGRLTCLPFWFSVTVLVASALPDPLSCTFIANPFDRLDGCPGRRRVCRNPARSCRPAQLAYYTFRAATRQPLGEAVTSPEPLNVRHGSTPDRAGGFPATNTRRRPGLVAIRPLPGRGCGPEPPRG